MGQFKSGGHTITESQGAFAPIQGVAPGVGVFIGFAEWGPIGEAIEINSFDDAKEKIGDFVNYAYLMFCLFAYFKKAGTGKAYVVRTAHYTDITDASTLTAIKANGYLAASEGPTNTLRAYAKYEGIKGNLINLIPTRTNKINTEITEALTTGADNIGLKRVDGVKVGTVLKITGQGARALYIHGTGNGALTFTTLLYGTSGNSVTIELQNNGSGKSLEVVSVTGNVIVIQLATNGGGIITTTATLLAALCNDDIDISALLSAAAGGDGTGLIATLGTAYLSGGGNNAYSTLVQVTNIVALKIYITRLTAQTGTINSTAPILSRDFKLEVYMGTELKETHDDLSMYSKNEAEYAITVIAEDSKYITLVDEGAGVNPLEPNTEKLLSSGDNGLTNVAMADLVGSLSGENGLYAMNPVDEIMLPAIVEMQGTAIGNGIIDFANQTEPKKYVAGVIDFEFDLSPAEAIASLQASAFVSNHVEMFYPNVKITNPKTNMPKTIPASAVVIGQTIKTIAKAGHGAWTPPAGVENGLIGTVVTGLENDKTNNKTYRDLLYPEKINPIYFKKGYGYLLYGVRTLEVSGGDIPQMNQRLTFLYCEKSIEDGTQWIEFSDLADTPLEKRFVRSVKQFLKGVWKDRGLEGATEEDAFTIVPDAESRGTSLFKAKIGLAVKTAKEFVWLDFQRKRIS